MIAFILKYWKFCVGALAGAIIMYGVSEARLWFINAAHAREIENTRRSVLEQCEEDKKLTQEISNEYQKQIYDLGRRLTELRRLQPALCIPIAGATGGRDAAAGAGPVDGNGIFAGTLYDFAGTAEQYRRQLIACQSFITRTWEAKRE